MGTQIENYEQRLQVLEKQMALHDNHYSNIEKNLQVLAESLNKLADEIRASRQSQANLDTFQKIMEERFSGVKEDVAELKNMRTKLFYGVFAAVGTALLGLVIGTNKLTGG